MTRDGQRRDSLGEGMIGSRTIVLMLLCAGVLALAPACAHKSPPPATPPAKPSPYLNDQDVRSTELQRRGRDLTQIAAQLPGSSAMQDRVMVDQAFDAASGALSLMGGPEPTGALQQQLRIIDNSRQVLRSNPSVPPDAI